MGAVPIGLLPVKRWYFRITDISQTTYTKDF